MEDKIKLQGVDKYSFKDEDAMWGDTPVVDGAAEVPRASKEEARVAQFLMSEVPLREGEGERERAERGRERERGREGERKRERGTANPSRKALFSSTNTCTRRLYSRQHTAAPLLVLLL